MDDIEISVIAFACIFGGVLLGILLRRVLPEHHFSADSKDIVKWGMGMVVTMAALVLGLLVASAKGSFEAQSNELTEMSAKIVLLDRLLANYGPETKDARDLLRASVAHLLDDLWSRDHTSHSQWYAPSVGADLISAKINLLSPKDDAQSWRKSQALSIVLGLGQTRWLMYAQRVSSVSMPLLVVLIFWLIIIFISCGLFAPVNATVVASLFLSALSVSGAIFLILEFYSPYTGVIAISSVPLHAALAHLGQ